MRIELQDDQKKLFKEFRAFANKEVAPLAADHDRHERIEPPLLKQMGQKGYFASLLPSIWGGKGLDMISYGLLHEEIGRACSSTRSLLTVHDMMAQSLLLFGNPAQQKKWLPRLASGEVLGAFAMSEPSAGSDLKSIQTEVIQRDDCFILNGRKTWITGGQLAGIFLVLARFQKGLSAFLVERDRQGFTVEPITGFLGTRGSMLATLRFDHCEIPTQNLVGGFGQGHPQITTRALNYGRLSVACGSVGIAQACLDASALYARNRKQFGVPIEEHQLIQQMIAEMVTNVDAARLLCMQAGYLLERGDPSVIVKVAIAKYFSSKAATKAALDAVQIHGAHGCSRDYPVERYLRDAKGMEIIEGSNQIQEMIIGKYGYTDQGSFVG